MRTFGFYIHHRNSSALTLVFETARDESEARMKAEQALAESLNRTRIDVWEDERALFSVTRDYTSAGSAPLKAPVLPPPPNRKRV